MATSKDNLHVREKLVELLMDRPFGNSTYEEVEEHMENTADYLLANGVTVQEWIPVSEGLPEVRVPVLTYGRKGAIGIGFVQPSSVTADGRVYFYSRYGDHLPTHWMPLPQPPKGDSV